MANYYGSARSNYVIANDIDGLRKSVGMFYGLVISDVSADGKVMFYGDDPDSGSFPSWASDEDGNDIEFSWVDHVMPFVKEGEVLVVQEAGAEKLRYIVGYAMSFMNNGHEVLTARIDLDDIYKKSADSFGVRLNDITSCTY